MQDERAYGEVFNIGSTEEISILELAERVRVVAESESPIALIPYEEAYEDGFEDMRRRVPDISKIGRFMGWSPTKNLRGDPGRRGRVSAGRSGHRSRRLERRGVRLG